MKTQIESVGSTLDGILRIPSSELFTFLDTDGINSLGAESPMSQHSRRFSYRPNLNKSFSAYFIISNRATYQHRPPYQSIANMKLQQHAATKSIHGTSTN